MRVYLSKYNWLIVDLIGVCLAFIVLSVVPVDIAAPMVYVSIFLLMLCTMRWQDLKRFGIATFIGVVWLLIAKDQYGYANDFATVWGYNIFPLFATPSALMGLWVLYKAAHVVFPVIHFWAKFILFTVFINWPLVIFVEYAGYHWIGIHNASTAMYPGLAFCDCMHAPWWMQLTYFAFGPIFFILSYLLDVHKHDDQV